MGCQYASLRYITNIVPRIPRIKFNSLCKLSALSSTSRSGRECTFIWTNRICQTGEVLTNAHFAVTEPSTGLVTEKVTETVTEPAMSLSIWLKRERERLMSTKTKTLSYIKPQIKMFRSGVSSCRNESEILFHQKKRSFLNSKTARNFQGPA